MQRQKGKWDDKVQKFKQGERNYKDDVQRAVKEDLKKVNTWKKTVFDKDAEVKQRAVEISDAYAAKKEEVAQHRTMEEQEANEKAFDHFRLQR